MKILRDSHLRFFLLTGLFTSQYLFAQENTLEKIHNALTQCKHLETSDRHLSERILSAAEQNAPGAGACVVETSEANPNIVQIQYNLDLISKNLKAKTALDFQQLIYEQSLKNTVSKLAYFMYAFESKNSPTLLQNNFFLNKEITALCTDENGKNACTAELRKNLLQTALETLHQLKASPIQPLSYAEIRDDINRRVDDLNVNYLSKISVPKGKSITYMDTPKHTDETKQLHADYIRRFEDLSSFGPGLLLHTDILSDRVGNERLLEEDLEKNTSVVGEKPSYIYKLHEPVSEKETVLAVKSIFFHLRKEAKYLHKINKSKNYLEKHLLNPRQTHLNPQSIDEVRKSNNNFIKRELSSTLKDLIMTHPVSVGQVLLDNPDFSEMTCTYISDINKDDLEKKKTSELLETGEKVLFGTSLFTGVVGLGTRFIFIGTAKLAAKTVGATIGASTTELATSVAGHSLTSSGISSGSAGLFGLINNGGNIKDNFHLEKTLEASYISDNGDSTSLEEGKKSTEILNHAADEIVKSGAEAAAAFLLIPRGVAVSKFGSVKAARVAKAQEKEKFLEQIIAIEKRIEIHPDLKSKFDTIRKMIQAKKINLKEQHLNNYFADLIDIEKRTNGRENWGFELTRIKHKSTEDLIKEIRHRNFNFNPNTESAKQLNYVNPEAFLRVYADIKAHRLEDMVRTLATDFEVSEVEMMKRVSNAHSTVREVYRELNSDKNIFQKIIARYNIVKDDPVKLRKFLFEEDGLRKIALWPYRSRVHIADTDLWKNIGTFVLIEMAMSAYNEKNKRGKQFWDQIDRFAANLVNVSFIEVALTATGGKTIYSAQKFMKEYAPQIKRLPVNIFGDWGEYTLKQRGTRYLKDVTRNQMIATTSSAVADHEVKKYTQTEEETSLNIQNDKLDTGAYILSTTSFMNMSSNPRYYAINSVMSHLNSKCKNKSCEDFVKTILPPAMAAANDSFGIRTGITWQNMMDKNMKEEKEKSPMNNPITWTTGASQVFAKTSKEFTHEEIFNQWILSRWHNIGLDAKELFKESN